MQSQTDRKIQRQIDRYIDRQIDIQTDRNIQGQIDIYIQTDRQIDILIDIQYNCSLSDRWMNDFETKKTNCKPVFLLGEKRKGERITSYT